MRHLLRSAFVIARRDYVATVCSRTFLLFLICPLLPVIFGVGISALSVVEDRPRAAPPLIAIAGARDGAALLAARAHLTGYLPHNRMPPLRIVPPPADPDALLAAAQQPAAILSGDLAHPVLTGPEARVLAGRVSLIVDQARQMQLLGPRVPPPVQVAVRLTREAEAPRTDALRGLARGAQTGLLLLIVILAGMLMTNLVEEKSSKVIEVLAAAVPVDAIFAGKLAGMLAVSLTGITAWAAMGAIALATFLKPGFVPAPEVGWPLFMLLAILYFSTLYLLVGAVFLGVGAQAASVREVQTLSMPLTVAQLALYGLASAGLPHPGGALGIAAMVVPWSSPYAMLARAAEDSALWYHPVALLWQAIWIVVVIRVSARLFRSTVLKSGSRRRRT